MLTTVIVATQSASCKSKTFICLNDQFARARKPLGPFPVKQLSLRYMTEDAVARTEPETAWIYLFFTCKMPRQAL